MIINIILITIIIIPILIFTIIAIKNYLYTLIKDKSSIKTMLLGITLILTGGIIATNSNVYLRLVVSKLHIYICIISYLIVLVGIILVFLGFNNSDKE